MKTSLCLPMVLSLTYYAVAFGQWLKVDTLTRGNFDDHSPQIDHGGVTYGYHNTTCEWLVFERDDSVGSSIAGIRFWGHVLRWDSSATIISPASPGVKQRFPDVCSFQRNEGGRSFSTVLAAWQKNVDGIWNIWYSISDSEGAGWSEPRALTSDSISGSNVKIRADSGLLVFWRRENTILYSIFKGKQLSTPETLLVSNFDSVECDFSKINRLVWTTRDFSTGMVCLLSGELTSLKPAAIAVGDTVISDGGICNVRSMYNWYNPFFTFDKRSPGRSSSHSAEWKAWMGPWMLGGVIDDSALSTASSCFAGRLYTTGGFWVWERQNEQDTSLAFSQPDTVAVFHVVDTFEGGNSPTMGSLFMIGDSSTSNIASWEATSGGHSHIYGRAYLFSIIDLGVKRQKGARQFNLGQNYPNPFNPTTTISYQLSTVSKIKLEVDDILGRKVETLIDAKQSPGEHSVIFDASKLASGVYFYRLVSEGRYETRKLMVLK